MLLSVIIPVYNVAPYLRRCVDSVLSQTYKEMEIILVDDGSTDGSGEICDEYTSTIEQSVTINQSSIRPLFKVLHKSNGGLSDARNAGLREASGEYVVFLDSDDEWLIRDGIEQMMNRLAERERDILLFKRVDIYPHAISRQGDHDVKYISTHTAQEVFEKNVLSDCFRVSACVQLLRRKLFEEHDLFFTKGLISEDVDFSCRLWQYAQTVDAINLEMYGCHRRENSITTSYSIRSLISYDWMFNHWKQKIENNCINAYPIGVLMANMYVSCSYNFFFIASNDREKAWQILLTHQDLLNYAASKKSMRMKKVVDAIGIKQGILLFATYGKLKKYYMALRHSLAK